MKRIKLQEYLKLHGYANSNKNAKRLIRDEIVKVNGVEVKSCSLMVGSDKSSAVEVILSAAGHGTSQSMPPLPPLTTPIQPFCIVYHKPCGMLCTKSPSEIFCLNHIDPPVPHHYHPVGRLDQHSHGLLLFSMDGRLTSALLSPSTAVERVYRIVVRGDVGTKALEKSCELRQRYDEICELVATGVETDYGFFKGRILEMQRKVDGNYEHSKCVVGGGDRNDKFDNKMGNLVEGGIGIIPSEAHETCILSSIIVAVKEGKKRMVRRLFAAIGLFVIGGYFFYLCGILNGVRHGLIIVLLCSKNGTNSTKRFR